MGSGNGWTRPGFDGSRLMPRGGGGGCDCYEPASGASESKHHSQGVDIRFDADMGHARERGTNSRQLEIQSSPSLGK